MESSLRIKKSTKEKLRELKEKYNFSSLDRTILALINNTRRLQIILKK